MVHGFKGEAKIVAGWEKKYKTPIISVAQNHVRALKAVKAKSFVGATYFPEKLNTIFAKYFTDAGFKVRSMAGIDVPFNKVQELSGEQIYAHIKKSFLKPQGRRRDLHARLRLAHARHHRDAGAGPAGAGGASGHRAGLGIPEVAACARAAQRLRLYAAGLPSCSRIERNEIGTASRAELPSGFRCAQPGYETKQT